MSKIIITIVGQDRVGIVAKTCNYLADHNMNILDITQTILQEYFNMMMIVDISGSKTSFDDMAHELDKLGQEIGVKILCQREQLMRKILYRPAMPSDVNLGFRSSINVSRLLRSRW